MIKPGLVEVECDKATCLGIKARPDTAPHSQDPLMLASRNLGASPSPKEWTEGGFLTTPPPMPWLLQGRVGKRKIMIDIGSRAVRPSGAGPTGHKCPA